MSTFDNTVAVIVAVIYNIFAHYVVSCTTTNMPHKDKLQKATMALLFIGFVAIFISKKLEDSSRDLDKQVLSRGLWYGGLLLVLTPIVSTLEDTTLDIQLVALVIILGGIIWLSNSWYESRPTKKIKSLDDLDSS